MNIQTQPSPRGRIGPNPEDTEAQPAHPCIAAADALLAQAVGFIEATGGSCYARTCPAASDGTIGKHLRHLLDHFAAVLTSADAPEVVIDYDHRERDVPMETSPSAALEAITALRARLGGLSPAALGRPVAIRVMFDSAGSTTDLRSTLGRELAFATHHALHHHAMMKFIADAFGEPSPAGFGRAPSTLHHERQGGGSATLSR